MAGSPVQPRYPSVSGSECTRVHSTSPAPATRIRAAIVRTTMTLGGYVSDGDEGKSKRFFRFRPKSRTEKYGADPDDNGINEGQRGSEELRIPPRAKTSHARDRPEILIPQSPLSRQPIIDFEETSIGRPISSGDIKIVVPIPTSSWRHPVLFASEHDSQVSPIIMNRLPSPAQSKPLQFHSPASGVPFSAPISALISEYPADDHSEMAPRRPSTASGAIEHGMRFSREASTPPPLPSRPESVSQTSVKRSRTRKTTKSVRDFAERESTSQTQTGGDKELLDKLKKTNIARDAAFDIKNGKKHHRYNTKEVPFPRNYDRLVLDHEVWEAMFYEQLVGGVSYLRFETPPERVLDIGCGPGAWIINSAKVWKNTHFFGVDIVPIQPDLTSVDPDLADRVTWVHANWLKRLPFPDNYFDFITVKRMSRAAPEDKINDIADELLRLLKPGCPVEIVEEDLYFPGTCKAESEDSGKGSDVSTTLSFNSGTSTSSEETYNYTQAQASSSSSSHIKKSDSFDEEACAFRLDRLDASADEFWHDQSPIYTPSSTRATIPPTQDQNIARRYYYQQGDLLSSPMSERPMVERATSDSEAMGSEHNLPSTHTLGLGADGQPYQNDSSQCMPSRSTSADNIRNGDAIIYDMDPANTIKKTSRMAGGASVMDYDREGTSRRSKSLDLYHPSVGQPLNPRDHSLLERIYNEMHADRFINLMPLSIFAMAMEILFARSTSTAPVSFTFPPRPRKRYFDEGFVDDYDPLLLTFDNGEVDHAIVQYAHNIVKSGRKGDALHSDEVQTQSSIAQADELASQYVIIDNARLPAAPARRPKARVSKKSASGGSLGATAMRPVRSRSVRPTISLSDDNAPAEKLGDSRPESPLMFASATESETASDESLPASALVLAPSTSSPAPTPSPPPAPEPLKKSLEVDLKSLNMHLSLRVAETLACAEAMWDWVLAEQGRYTESQKRRQYYGSSYAVGHEEEDLQLTAIREMSRADFDSCLSRFEMDMQDKIALDHALDQYLHIRPRLVPNRSAERRSFDNACAAWDAIHATELGLSDGQSSNSAMGDTRYISRTMRIYNGYKPMW